LIAEHDSLSVHVAAIDSRVLVTLFKNYGGSLVYAMVRARQVLPVGLDQMLFHAPRDTASSLASVPDHLNWLVDGGTPELPVACGPAIDIHGRRWEDLERHYADSDSTTPSMGSVRDGRILGRQLSVLTSRGDVILDCSPMLRAATKPGFGNPTDPAEHRTLRRYVWLPPPRRLRGSVAVVGCAGAGNYYHWLIDALPRLIALRDSGKFRASDYVAVPRSSLPAIHESLALLGIDRDRIVSFGRWTQVQADQVLVASATSHLIGPTSTTVSGLRRSFRDSGDHLSVGKTWTSVPTSEEKSIVATHSPGAKSGRRLLIIRRSTRAFQRSDAVVAALKPFGFEPVCLDGMRFTDQIVLFSSARAVVGVHGAGLANIVWCSPGTRLLECYPSNYLNPCFRSLSAASGMLHSFIVSKVDRQGSLEVDLLGLSRWAQST